MWHLLWMESEDYIGYRGTRGDLMFRASDNLWHLCMETIEQQTLSALGKYIHATHWIY